VGVVREVYRSDLAFGEGGAGKITFRGFSGKLLAHLAGSRFQQLLVDDRFDAWVNFSASQGRGGGGQQPRLVCRFYKKAAL